MDRVSSLPVLFDDLMRHYDLYMNYGVDSEFLEFVTNYQRNVLKKWQEAEKECERLQVQIESDQNELARAETKIKSIRSHLESKIEVQSKLSAANEKANLKIDSAKVLIRSYLGDPRTGVEAKERIVNILAILEGSGIDDHDGRVGHYGRSPNVALDAISEANSTDLSMTQSEDDLDVSTRRAQAHRKRQTNHRPSLEFKSNNGNNSRFVKNKQTMEMSQVDRIVVKTVVSSKKASGGSLNAVATVDTRGGSKSSTSSSDMHYAAPSAPPLLPSDTESDAPPYQAPRKTPPSYALPSTSYGASSRYGARTQRAHSWCQKTVIKPETCEPCGKRIKFSKVAFKCRDCKATCHPECKEKVPLPCIMTGTPSSNKHQMGTVTDYAPTSHPMVPALIQHCVNAIESRGQDIVGLYRVPGPEKEVKDLKERFLKGKGVPNLLRYDIHSVCGCIKDFLKTIQEPLVGRWSWKDFAIAAEISDSTKRMVELERIVKELPPANQDTLAYVILHLQRIAQLPEVKMPISNLSKVFGPTIVGYSGPDIDGPTMLKETKKQQQIMESFLLASFWDSLLNRSVDNDKLYDTNRSYGLAQSTPKGKPSSVLRLRESNKRIYFDDSPKDRPVEKQRKNYFD